jgi:hypothetical protein
MAEGRTLSADTPMRGAAVAQRFLPGGASVVITQDARVCLVSQRIDIAASDYRDRDGASVAFADVVRSPAAVVQAIAGAGEAAAFRIQMKFSPEPGAPILLDLPGGARDLATLLEPSGDSLLIEGALARDLAAAFAQGARPALRSLSHDTGRSVTDRLDAPDMAALAACAETQLAAIGPDAPAETPTAAPATLVRAVFEAAPSAETIASPGQLQACGMQDRPETLHLGRLQAVTGFVSHTDKVFVSFAPDGAVERVYIPGIYDADLRAPGQGGLRVSRAADGNVPAAPNTVSGCIGAEAMAVCYSDMGGGGHALTACPDDGLPTLFSSREYNPLISVATPRSALPPVLPPMRARVGTPIGGGGFPLGGTTTSRPPQPPGGPSDPEPPVVTEDLVLSITSSTPMHGGGGTPPGPPPADPPSPVPIPAGLWLILAALGALAGLRGARGGSAFDAGHRRGQTARAAPIRSASAPLPSRR